jgi:hypothetical protein
MWTNEQLAYLAGIIDGEGTIGIEKMAPCGSRKKFYYTPRLCIINTSKNLMEWLNQTFPFGHFSPRKKIAGRKECYAWRLFGTNVETIIVAILPFIQIKRRQAECVLRFRKTVGKTGWNVSDETLSQRESLYQECKIYNTVGE